MARPIPSVNRQVEGFLENLTIALRIRLGKQAPPVGESKATRSSYLGLFKEFLDAALSAMNRDAPLEPPAPMFDGVATRLIEILRLDQILPSDERKQHLTYLMTALKWLENPQGMDPIMKAIWDRLFLSPDEALSPPA